MMMNKPTAQSKPLAKNKNVSVRGIKPIWLKMADSLVRWNDLLVKWGISDSVEATLEGDKPVLKYKGEHAAELHAIADEPGREAAEFRNSDMYKSMQAAKLEAELAIGDWLRSHSKDFT